MTKADEIQRLFAAFGAAAKAERIQAYLDVLDACPPEAVSAAVNEVIEGDEWSKVPPPVVIHRTARRYDTRVSASAAGDAFEMRRKLIENKIRMLLSKPIVTARMSAQIERLERMLLNDYRWEG